MGIQNKPHHHMGGQKPTAVCLPIGYDPNGTIVRKTGPRRRFSETHAHASTQTSPDGRENGCSFKQ